MLRKSLTKEPALYMLYELNRDVSTLHKSVDNSKASKISP